MWRPEDYLLAVSVEPYTSKVSGYTYRGLGLHVLDAGSPGGRRKPTWRLTHLGTGCSLADIKGDVATAFPVATEIAECSDWDFISLDGWRDRDPEIGAKVNAIIGRHKNATRAKGAATREMTEIAAQSVAMARA